MFVDRLNACALKQEQLSPSRLDRVLGCGTDTEEIER